MFRRGGEEVLTFRVYDSVGNCISEFTGTMTEWQKDVVPVLAGAARHDHAPRTRAWLN